jgi:hypothetical protein
MSLATGCCGAQVRNFFRPMTLQTAQQLRAGLRKISELGADARFAHGFVIGEAG